MNKLTIAAIAAAVSLSFGTTAFANAMTKSEYKAAQDNIKAGYLSAKAACEPFVANAKDICLVEAKGKENVQKAELKEKNHPGRKAHYEVRIAIADSEYGAAREKCDDMAGNAKDVCVKEAKAAHTAAKADAVAQRKVTAANKMAKEKSVRARSEAHEKIVDAKQDAAAEKQRRIQGGDREVRRPCRYRERRLRARREGAFRQDLTRRGTAKTKNGP